MSKRKKTKFDRREADFYPTPREAVLALSRHLDGITSFAEPMVGDGAIVAALADKNIGIACAFASDISPQGKAKEYAEVKDVLLTTSADFADAQVIISNPPWPSPNHFNPSKLAIGGRGQPTIQIIKHLIQFKPCWMLLSADFAHNGCFNELAPYCRRMVSVGRVVWFDMSKVKDPITGEFGKKMASKDNVVW
ncbi:MAG: hypothetical protein K8953_04085, partial [Proteobacteria bacterium]|nr:hypothetical protein [Pseudomonadota bacterium]